MTEQLLISAMLIAPLAGWLLAMAMPDWRSSAMVVSAALTSAVAVSWLALSYAGMIEFANRVTVGEWLVMPDGNGLAVSLAFHADQSRCILVLAASLILLLRTVEYRHTASDAETRVTLLFPLSIAAIMVTDLVVMASLWFVIDCCVPGMVAREERSDAQARRRFNTTTILSCSGVLLLLASMMAMARYDSSIISEIVAGATEDHRIDAATVASGLSVLIVAAVSIRCAFFPALIWPRSCLSTRSRDVGFVVVLAGILPGMSLAVALMPLGTIASEALLLLGMLGILTCFTATGVALVQNGATQIATLLSIGAAGLSAAGVATSSQTLGHTATSTLFAQLIAIFVLQRCRDVSKREVPFGIALLISVSGIGGANAILSLVENSPAGIEKIAEGDSAGHPLVCLWWGIVVSQILWGVAVVKLATRHSSNDASQIGIMNDSKLGAFVATIAACLALITCMIPLRDAQAALPVRLLTFGAATPACFLGVVAAWLLSQASDGVRDRVVGSLDSLTRLCREWFYLEDAVRYGVKLPVRGLGLLAEVCDRRILGGRSEDGWKQAPTRIADSFEYLRTLPAAYFGLTGVLLVVGLLWALD